MLALAAIGLTTAPPARAQDAERMAMANLRLSTEAAIARGCTRIGFASDDSLKDLRRKIVRTGGDTAVLSFRGRRSGTDPGGDLSLRHLRGRPGSLRRRPRPRRPPPPPPPPVTR